MKQIDYTMRVKFEDNSSVWNEDNSALVGDHVTIEKHAKETVKKYNQNPKLHRFRVFVLARQLPKKYIIPIKDDI